MQYEWSETFLSIEGEGPYSGWPTAYIRFSGCNFKCPGFNNPCNDRDEKGYAPLHFVPADIQSLSDIDEIIVGCDSQYAVNPAFRHIWHRGTEDDLAKNIMELLPHNAWVHGETSQRHILSLTGGEPTLQWKKIPTLLNHPLFAELRYILIETNCAVPFKPEFIDQLQQWVRGHNDRKIIWSNSPKLPISGEKWEKAIRPEIAYRQIPLHDSRHQFEQYFKFVCGPSKEDFDMVEKAMTAYHSGGIKQDNNVYIMPMACTEDQQEHIAADVADMCLQRGYIYCHRIHNSVYKNAIGK